MGRGERETRGEHRGRGERLPSGSRFVFPGASPCLVLLLSLVPSSLAAQEPAAAPSGFSIGLRVSGVYATPLFRDGIGNSIIPDTLIEDRFARDSLTVTTAIAPDVTLAIGLPLAETTELELAAGYTLADLRVTQRTSERDAGSLAIGHAVVAVRKPVRGFHLRGGIGAMWFHGSDLTVMREARGLNPLIEVAATRRWTALGFDIDAGLVGQATQVSSQALQDRGGPAGMLYRIGVELGAARRIGR